MVFIKNRIVSARNLMKRKLINAKTYFVTGWSQNGSLFFSAGNSKWLAIFGCYQFSLIKEITYGYKIFSAFVADGTGTLETHTEA